jgi:hypothetical protein
MFQSADIMLSTVALDFTTHSSSIIKWTRDEYNLVILSTLYAEPPQLVHMVTTFSLQTWIFIINSIIIISLCLILNEKFISNFDFYKT